jgi:molecular chaperone DnaK
VDDFLNHKRQYALGDSMDVYEKMKDKSVLDLIQETIQCTDICLQSGSLEKTDLDEIFLVGGSSSIPIISKMITEQYGLEPHQSKISPALSISVGAAIYCHMIMQPTSEGVSISEKTIHSVGLEMAGRRYLEIIPAGVDIPEEGLTVSLEEPLETNFDGLTSMVIVVYESMFKRDQHTITFVYDEGMKRLAGTSLEGIPSAPKGHEKVQITFHLSKDYILGVTAKSLSNEGVQTTLSVEALY